METSASDRLIEDAFAQLQAGRAIVRTESISTLPHSCVFRVTLSDGTTMFLKHAGGAQFADGIRKEIAVNRGVLAELTRKVAPSLLLANDDQALPWLIFEDISTSHQALPTGVPPAFGFVDKLVATLAATHAQTRQLDLPRLFSNVQGDIYVTDGSEQVSVVLDQFLYECPPDRFPDSAFSMIRKIRDHVPELVGLISGGEAMLIHGDAHFWNALYADDALLLDWALAVIGPGEVDLCHALAMNLPRYFAAAYEPALLRQYVLTCAESGFEQNENEVLERYRMCLLLTILVAVGMRTVPGMPDSVWTYMLTNALHAALDHESVTFLS